MPKPEVYSRFLKILFKHYELIQTMFSKLVKEITTLLPDFGKTLAIDGKAILSYGKKKGKREGDMRGEHDADWGKHEYNRVDENDRAWEKIKKWFGFTLHLIVDAKYELPVMFTVTKASKNEMPVAHILFNRLEKENKDTP